MAELLLQGKSFTQIKNSTFEHDCWFMRKMNESGINSIPMREGETLDALAARYTREALGNPHILDLFGGLMIPTEIAPEHWTPAIATETTRYIAGITDPDAKQLLYSQIASMVADFFLSGAAALKISPTSSAEPAAAPAFASAAS